MKKLLSLVLALAIVASCLGIISFATEGTNNQETFKAAKYTELESTNRKNYVCRWNPNLLWKEEEINDDLDGTFTFSYTIYNTGEEAIQAELKFNTVTYREGGVEKVPNSKNPDTSMVDAYTEREIIEPGESADFEISITAENGWTTFISGGTTYNIPLNYITIRLALPVFSVDDPLRSFVIVKNDTNGDYFVDNFPSTTEWEMAAATEDDLPGATTPVTSPAASPTPKVATGVKLTTTDEADSAGLYFVSSAGLISADDVKNNEIVKTIKVKNESDATILVKLCLQATISNQWKSPDGAVEKYFEIEPGKVEEVVCTVPCANGKPSKDGTDIELKNLFARFGLQGEDGPIPEGTSFIIYFEEKDAGFFKNMLKSGNAAHEMWRQEFVYDAASGTSTAPGASTGDVLPVAIMATVALSFVALVVVSKKRKED